MQDTPKHGSWLNPAELEASLWSRQCLGRQRVASLTELRERTSAWNRWANRTKLKIDWRISIADARRVFHYQRIAIHESEALVISLIPRHTSQSRQTVSR